ncbi:signal recognition particle protein Srp19 [Thermococcus waiotapuensis]|uniref:Signal recognition particle protein Srp19 n=1 Tax=Thermococcus waiotapuensis TaxID=90909 RepID=A0AAE4NWS4_9EURY|nr:signal recognition particle protein Srp19 [Thermococcus waiotapuensis]MDV3104742.1 signal recognition particle protein Srp19 [Thermococcus waiotapuensis]
MPRFVVWPSELDGRLSRKYGRLVPKTMAVDSPSFSELEDALLALGVKIIEKDHTKLNPRLSGLEEELRTRGFFVVESPHGKAKTLKMVAQKIRELRKRSEDRKEPKRRKR